MIPATVTLAGALAAGAAAAVGTYRLVMVPDLFLQLRAGPEVRRATLWDRVTTLLWGPNYHRAWAEVGADPVTIFRVSILCGGLMVLVAFDLHLGLVLGTLLGLGVTAGSPRLWVRRARLARRRAIIAELPQALGPLLEGVKLGVSPPEALREGMRYTQPEGPLHREIERVLAQTRAEHDFALALTRFASRVEHPLVADLCKALTVAFDERLDDRALSGIMERLNGLQTQLVDEAIKAVPTIMAGSMMLMWMALTALGVIFVYGWVSSGNITAIL